MKKREPFQNIPLLQLAIAHHKAGNLAQAERCYREIINSDPNNPDANHNLGQMFAVTQKRPGLGLPLLKHALAVRPTAPQFWKSYINALVKLELYTEAQSELASAQRHIPETDFAQLAKQQFLSMALGFSKKFDWQNTLIASQNGLRFDENNAQLLHAMGYSYLQMAQYDLALAPIRKAAEITNDAHMWNHLGVALLNSGALKEAQSMFQKSIAINPSLAAAWSNAASAAQDLFEYNQATEFAKRALELDHQSEKALLILGMTSLRNGELESSKRFLQAAIKSATENSQSIYRPAPRPITTHKARAALLDARQCLNEKGIPFFLCSGTLLGIIRGGDILEFDKDMDIGVPAHIDRQDALNALIANNKFVLSHPELASPDSWNWNFSVTHQETNIAMDLFFYHEDGDHLVCGIYTKPTPIKSTPRKFQMEKLIWQDVEWQIPSPPEQYLEDFYGKEWRIPDPLFDTVISSQCQTPESRPVRCGFGYVKLYDSLTSKRWKKAYAYCSQILNLGSDEFITDIQTWLLTTHASAINSSNL